MYIRKQIFQDSDKESLFFASENVNIRHLKGLKNFAEEYSVKKLILVSNDPFPRRIGDIMIMPWKVFLNKLWAGEIIN